MGKNIKDLEAVVKTFLATNQLKGENFDDTPNRVARLWDTFLTPKPLKITTFPTENKAMAVIKGVVLWGFCPHHLLPIKYTFKIGYIPNGCALGLSKLPRLAESMLNKFPLQEDLPCLVTQALEDLLEPKGCGCYVEGFHLCIAMRGVEQQNATFITTSLKGVLLKDPSSQQEFLRY